MLLNLEDCLLSGRLLIKIFSEVKERDCSLCEEIWTHFYYQERRCGQKGQKFAIYSWSGCFVKEGVGAQFFSSGESSELSDDSNGKTTFSSCPFCSLFQWVFQDIWFGRYGFRKYAKQKSTVNYLGKEKPHVQNETFGQWGHSGCLEIQVSVGLESK